MASVTDYLFNNLGRIGNDKIDESQKTVHNTRFANHMLSDYFSDNLSDKHVNFATKQPSVQFSGLAHGNGLSGLVIDANSNEKRLKEEKNKIIEIDSKYYETEKRSNEDLNGAKNKLKREIDKVKELINLKKCNIFTPTIIFSRLHS